ncbi:MAG: dipeptide epimerase [Rhodobacteraceae bacterium TMED111]|nr:dipeptide epimerase [Marinovum sp.]OUV45302.1 MAG: dipeptide epimerase [Rhodobacteraceae bacterium TMED111]
MIQAKVEIFPLAQVFRISRGARTQAEVVTVIYEKDGIIGRGECVPYARYNETLESVTKQIEDLPDNINKETLQQTVPPGAARNAVDCALWDFECKKLDQRIWETANVQKPEKIITAYTLSLDEPENMFKQAEKNSNRPLLKIKLGTPNDMPRLEAVRKGAPNSEIIVDANEGWDAEVYSQLAPQLVRLGVKLVEQPLPADKDDDLIGLPRPLPICADESCHDRKSLEKLIGKYDFVNIKLDKTGGLTEALLLKNKALEAGFKIMVGCMVGSSLAMAPATLIAQNATFVDLDGPLLLAQDRQHGLLYDESWVHPPVKDLWG